MHGEEQSACGLCGGNLRVIGSRRRKLIESDGSTRTLVIRRLRCRLCRKIHHELPDIVVPYKRHSVETIEKVIDGDRSVCCEESTIRRIRAWWIAMRVYFNGVMAALSARYGTVFPQTASPREVVRAAANAHLWAHTRSAFRSG